MKKVALILQDEQIEVDQLEEILEALKPILALTTDAKVSVVVLDEG
ncbi:hypothetical protein ES703_97428 [subsurface metagenome]